jgi:hypothetical protein
MLPRPRMILEEFFDGQCIGWGIMQSRFGKLQRRFDIAASGEWDEPSGMLHLRERYEFDDGQVDLVSWSISKKSDERYIGREPTIVGDAQGDQGGEWYRWRYRRDVPGKEGSSTRLGFDDWFWLQNPKVLLAKARVSKLNVRTADMTVVYQKR